MSHYRPIVLSLSPAALSVGLFLHSPAFHLLATSVFSILVRRVPHRGPPEPPSTPCFAISFPPCSRPILELSGLFRTSTTHHCTLFFLPRSYLDDTFFLRVLTSDNARYLPRRFSNSPLGRLFFLTSLFSSFSLASPLITHRKEGSRILRYQLPTI